VLGLHLPFPNGDVEAAGADDFTPNAFIRIEGGGQIVLTMPYVEMGHGHLHINPDADRRRTRGGSEPGAARACSTQREALRQPAAWHTGNRQFERDTWGMEALREAGATARAMLISAAANRWNVDPASCRAQSGEVLHAPTARSFKYGELAAEAASIAVPPTVALKRPEDFKIIGTPAKRLDTPAKSKLERRSMASTSGYRT